MAKCKIINYVRDTWLILGVTVLFLVLLEGMFAIAFLVRDSLTVSNPQMPDRLSRPADDRDSAWVAEYDKELEENVLRWEPYVYWRRKPYTGKYINISTDGIRFTSNSQIHPDKEGRSLRVF